MKNDLPITEELDFAYLLDLMPALHDMPNFALLPELFAILGHEKLILLCKYAGGETIKVPTLSQLSDSIEALQWFYDVQIKHTKEITEVPVRLHPLVNEILLRFKDA